jgi:hypothetical protein
MNRLLAALALAFALLWPAALEARPRRTCLPINIEGAGTVWVCVFRSRR